MYNQVGFYKLLLLKSNKGCKKTLPDLFDFFADSFIQGERYFIDYFDSNCLSVSVEEKRGENKIVHH